MTDILIKGVDLDWQREEGRLPTFVMGSPLFFMTATNGIHQVLLPDCEDSYAIMGKLLMTGVELSNRILADKEVMHLPLSCTDSIYFIQTPGYELLISSDPFNQQYNIQYVKDSPCLFHRSSRQSRR